MDSNHTNQPQPVVNSSPTTADASIDIVESSHAAKGNTACRCIHKVPQHCLTEENRHVFEPEVISIGPYHFNKPTLSRTEKFKAEMLNMFITESMAADPTKDKAFFFKEILERITEIRSNYADPFLDCCDDNMLASVILNDIAFMVIWIEDCFRVTDGICIHLGYSTVEFLTRDLIKLENQIPFWIIKRVMDLRFGKNKAEEILRKYLSFGGFLDEKLLTKLPWDDTKEQPLHLLEAYRATLLEGKITPEAKLGTVSRFLTKFTNGKVWKADYNTSFKEINPVNTFNYPFRSVTYLKAKGIYFRPGSHSLRDITFTSNPCYGVLQLPFWFVSSFTDVFFSNLVAFEMSPGNLPDFHYITSYVNFMKSLIESKEDVKELRESGILFTDLGSDEDIVKAFKGIVTHGYSGFGIFKNLKMGIDEHCNSKAKTWINDLIHSHFSSPWAAIGLFAAIIILCLTFIQTYFTIDPVV